MAWTAKVILLTDNKLNKHKTTRRKFYLSLSKFPKKSSMINGFTVKKVDSHLLEKKN